MRIKGCVIIAVLWSVSITSCFTEKVEPEDLAEIEVILSRPANVTISFSRSYPDTIVSYGNIYAVCEIENDSMCKSFHYDGWRGAFGRNPYSTLVFFLFDTDVLKANPSDSFKANPEKFLLQRKVMTFKELEAAGAKVHFTI